jgi:hypothetical protein
MVNMGTQYVYSFAAWHGWRAGVRADRKYQNPTIELNAPYRSQIAAT